MREGRGMNVRKLSEAPGSTEFSVCREAAQRNIRPLLVLRRIIIETSCFEIKKLERNSYDTTQRTCYHYREER